MLHYFVVSPGGEACGHRHRSMGARLAECWRTRGKGQVWYVNHEGAEIALSAAALGPLRALLPTRGPGRPVSRVPLTEQGRPLYTRLSVTERARFEAAALVSGVDLGTWVVTLMEREAGAIEGQAKTGCSPETP